MLMLMRRWGQNYGENKNKNEDETNVTEQAEV